MILLRSFYPQKKNDLRARRASFVKRASKAHNNRYEYSDFLSLKQFVTCFCPVHNYEWKAIANTHVQGGKPCPHCQPYTSTHLYFWKFDNHPFYKVGVGEKARIINVANTQNTKPVILRLIEVTNDPRSLEAILLLRLRQQFKQPITHGDGYTEIFKIPSDQLSDVLKMFDELTAPYKA